MDVSIGGQRAGRDAWNRPGGAWRLHRRAGHRRALNGLQRHHRDLTVQPLLTPVAGLWSRLHQLADRRSITSRSASCRSRRVAFGCHHQAVGRRAHMPN